MRQQLRSLVIACLAVALVAVGVSACGSSAAGGGNAQALLQQTFSGHHRVASGVLDLSLRIVPTGSSKLTKPITLRFSGPFQDRGAGRAPASDLTLTGSLQGQTGSFSIISTGTSGYITVGSHSYRLPAASFKQLQRGFAAANPAGEGAGDAKALHQLGINPLNWLIHPTVAGSATIGGAPTTEIRANVDVEQLLADVNRALTSGKLELPGAGSTAAGQLRKGIPAQTQVKLAKELGNPLLEVWTGEDDRTLRQLSLSLQLPVSGEISKALGSLRSLAVNLTLTYRELNQPQTITAPKHTEPFAALQQQVEALVGAIEGGLGSLSTGGSSTGGSSTGGSSTGAAGAGSGVSGRYLQCVKRAGGDVAKMQSCTPLAGGG